MDEPSIADFVQNWAARKQKKLSTDDAAKVAADILAEAEKPPPDDDLTPRLGRIHKALLGALQRL